MKYISVNKSIIKTNIIKTKGQEAIQSLLVFVTLFIFLI